MPYTDTQNEFNQNLHAVQNSNTRNSREMNFFSENNFQSENNFKSQSVTVNDNFVSLCTVSYQPIYSTAGVTGLGLLTGHSNLRGLPQVQVGPGSSVTWSTTTTAHPVHRESTSSYVVGQGQPRSVNSATDFDVRHGLPPSMFNHYSQSSTRYIIDYCRRVWFSFDRRQVYRRWSFATDVYCWCCESVVNYVDALRVWIGSAIWHVAAAAAVAACQQRVRYQSTVVGHHRAATVDFIYVVYQSTRRRRASVPDTASVFGENQLEALS